MVHDSKKPQELGFMVQDQFSRPLFCVASAFWVYRGSVSVEQRHCLCGTDTVSVWDTHSVSVWDTHSPGGWAGGSRTTPTPHWGFPVPTHTSKIAIPQLRGDNGPPGGGPEGPIFQGPLGPGGPWGLQESPGGFHCNPL